MASTGSITFHRPIASEKQKHIIDTFFSGKYGDLSIAITVLHVGWMFGHKIWLLGLIGSRFGGFRVHTTD
jgi:hypothetical protein